MPKLREDYTLEEINSIKSEIKRLNPVKKRNVNSKRNIEIFNQLIIKYPNCYDNTVEMFRDYYSYKSTFCPCGKRLEPNSTLTYCSRECRSKYQAEHLKETNLNRYGCWALQLDSVKDKRAKTNLIKYGCVCTLQSAESKIKTRKTKIARYGTPTFNNIEKSKRTQFDRYGCWASQTIEFRTKVIQTNLARYNEVNAAKNELIKQRQIDTYMLKYGCTHPKKQHLKNMDKCTESYFRANFISDKGYFKFNAALQFFNMGHWLLNKYKQKFNINVPNERQKLIQQRELYEFICSLISPENVRFCDRTLIFPKEIDVYAPAYRVGFEYDGLMFHSFGIDALSKFTNVPEDYQDLTYHQNKNLDCLEKRVSLFHILENEWNIMYTRRKWCRIIKNELTDKTIELNELNESHLNITKVGLNDAEKILDEYSVDNLLGEYHYLVTYNNVDLCLLCICLNEELELVNYVNLTEYKIINLSMVLNLILVELQRDTLYINMDFRLHPNIPMLLNLRDIKFTFPEFKVFTNRKYNLINDTTFQNQFKSSDFNQLISDGYRLLFDCGRIQAVLK